MKLHKLIGTKGFLSGLLKLAEKVEQQDVHKTIVINSRHNRKSSISSKRGERKSIKKKESQSSQQKIAVRPRRKTQNNCKNNSWEQR